MKNLSLLVLLWLPIALFSQGTATPAEPDPDVFQIVDREPSPINMEEVRNNIGWPEEAKEVNGRVVVRVLLDEKGSYVKHVVIKDPHPALAKAVTDQLPLLRCTPAIAKGKPVQHWITIPFQFYRND
jgi:outer membrane biosynthesis protein TonB